MAPKTTCECGTCRKCKHRAYMRQWYHRTSDAWQTRDYDSCGSGGMVTVRCRRCGKDFERSARKVAWKDGVAYCSRACKEADRNERLRAEREQSKPDRKCRHCGKDMPKRMRADAAYCSNRCNVAAHSQARKASERTGAKEKRIDRAYIIERDGGRCHLCGRFPRGRELTIDHVIPLARGGQHSSENLRVACLSCNAAKRDRAVNDQILLVG